MCTETAVLSQRTMASIVDFLISAIKDIARFLDSRFIKPEQGGTKLLFFLEKRFYKASA